MTNEEADFESLHAELRSLIRTRSPEAVAELDLPTMDRLGGTGAGIGTEPLIANYQSFLDGAIRRLPEGPYSRAAAALFADLGSGASVKERNTSASGSFGIGYDAFRRAGASGVSKEDEIIRAVADVMMSKPSTSSPDSSMGRAGAIESSRGPLGGRLVAGVVVAGVVAALGLFVIVQDHGGSSSASSASPLVSSTTASVPSTSASSSSTTASSTSTAPTILIQPTSIAPDPFVGSKRLGEVEVDCQFGPGETDGSTDSSASWTAAFQATYRSAGGKEALGCPNEPMTDRGGMQWQELQRFGFANGGLIGVTGRDVMLLNRGQWRSFIRVGGGDGSASPALGGFPTGDVVETSDGWFMKVDGEIELIGEGEDSSYYWVPKIVLDLWDEAGRSAGIHGSPAGSPRIVPEGVRQDFTNGYFLFEGGGLDWVPVDDVSEDLPPAEELLGHIISAADGTGWLIDDELRRWWLVDIPAWACAGGSPNEIAKGLPGYAIHTLDFAGVATCPAEAGGAYSAGGALEIDTYCTNSISIGARAEVVDDRWNCVEGAVRQEIDMQLLCQWQYGPESYSDESEGLYGIVCKT